MKICGIICEYNPFHNGHAYQISEAKKRSGADAVVCILGGDFTQRGEAAIAPDTLRAKHAVQCGAETEKRSAICNKNRKKRCRCAGALGATPKNRKKNWCALCAAPKVKSAWI